MKFNLLLILFVPLLFSCNQQPSDISQWRGPDRDGYYPDQNLLKEWPADGPELIWKFEGLGKGYTTVAVTKDKIFTTGTFDSTSYLFALDHSGELVWKKEFGLSWLTNFPGTRSTPQIVDGLGYVLSGRGKLVCFNTDNGFTVWTKDLYKDFQAREIRFGMTENLLVDGNIVYCTPGGIRNNVVALNRKTGDVIWSSKGNMEPSAYCSPRMVEINGTRVFLTITAKSILALDPDNGNYLWSHDLQYPHGIHGNSPIVHDGMVFAMNGWEHGSVMMKINEDGSGVEEVWRSTLFDLEHGDVMLINGNIYGTDYETKHFSCVDWQTGTVKDSIKEFAPGTVISADEMIYCYAYSGDVALIKPKEDGFDVVSSFKAPGKKRDHLAHPVINDGKLFLRYDDALMVYNISNKENI